MKTDFSLIPNSKYCRTNNFTGFFTNDSWTWEEKQEVGARYMSDVFLLFS
jgi:hypothetical protein